LVTYIGRRPARHGHTLKNTVAAVKAITGLEPKRTFVDKGYRGHVRQPPTVPLW
jgi:hypothetical protein